MPTALEKARQDPDSMKARILAVARRVFAQYGYHGATTRVIAKEVGIDISTLYYHWGEKEDLYEAVIFHMAEDLRQELRRVEKIIRGRPLAERMEISIDQLTEYLFEHPEISNLIVLRFVSKTRQEMKWDAEVPEFVTDIARSMGLSRADGSVSVQAKMQVLTVMNAIHSFVAGEGFFSSLVQRERPDYVTQVKETLKFVLIPAFAGPFGSTAAEQAMPPTSGPVKTGRKVARPTGSTT